MCCQLRATQCRQRDSAALPTSAVNLTRRTITLHESSISVADWREFRSNAHHDRSIREKDLALLEALPPPTTLSSQQISLVNSRQDLVIIQIPQSTVRKSFQ
jgi:hypothetical protein